SPTHIPRIPQRLSFNGVERGERKEKQWRGYQISFHPTFIRPPSFTAYPNSVASLS
ncbi:hypothetical protein SOVF_154560, partial [Spinacia oleracea]